MIGIRRYVRILELFDQEGAEWTMADLSKRLDTSASTLYRLVREMVAEGMLENTVESRYRLGAFFIEYYRRIGLTDPLIRSGRVFLAPLMQQVSVPCTVILARLYGNTVMCVAESRSPLAAFETSYQLGRPMPMIHGATSKAVLSTMPPRKVKVFLKKELLLGEEALLKMEDDLTAIRKRDLCVTQGEVDHGLVGLAVPIKNSDMGINASVSIIMEAQTLTDELRPLVLAGLSTTARLIERFMQEAFAQPNQG